MTAAAIILCILCQLLLVAGQLLLKKAMSPAEGVARRRVVGRFVLGIGCLTAWFFLWLGLLAGWPLSKLFPFEGLNPALMALAAWVFLRERMPVVAWVGIGLITVGIVVVSGS